MDELAMVRAELARLEEDERRLVRQLSDIRAAASAQRKRIEELIQTRGPLIHRLPVEILSSIFHLALRRTNPSRKDILACVSRHWRNIILDQPSFWSKIEIASSRSLGRAKKHLKKSREIPLDITIRKGFLDSNDTIREELDFLVPFANRWRSLSIFTRPDSVFRPAPRSILDCIGAINFPSLRCVKLDLGGDTFPTFLSSTNVPVLEHLEIRNFHLNLRSMSGTPFSEHIPVLTLVTLWLSGDMLPCSLQPDSVHFPVLETLNVSLRDGADFFKAIVTPKLKSIDYTHTTHFGSPLSAIFSSLEDKFSSVKQLSFTINFGDLDSPDARALCRAFPNVHHVQFCSAFSLSPFFSPWEGIDGLRSPACYWKSLESVIFGGTDSEMWLETLVGEINAFVQWLVARRDQRQLRVHIKSLHVLEEAESFCMLYERLREHCVVELDSIHLRLESRLLRLADSCLQLYLPTFTSVLTDDIGVVLGNID
ncbi:hypothetical protein EDD16DRAFT_1713135 [Pisolithus croceorrhizus]|nr:hypothetical protein EDD16DRAFT_1713135 [Pisolithus croceorrhizus]KAI6152945.1 hypothetical protein EDD17DRAFT_1851077 [Pisolithus thermaeus]